MSTKVGGDACTEQAAGGLRREEQAEAVGVDAEAVVREEGEDSLHSKEGDVPDRRAEGEPEQQPVPEDVRGPGSRLLKQRVTRTKRSVRYLRAGSVIAATGSGVYDFLSPANEFIEGLCLLTDGEWFCHTDLAHYVERYHVPVDGRFVDHAHHRGWLPPQLSDDQLVQIAGPAVVRVHRPQHLARIED